MKWIKTYIQTLLESSNQHDLNERLIAACTHGSIEEIRMLIEKGADVNAEDTQKNTSLHAAASFGHIEPVKLLLQRGAHVDVENVHGRTPLWYASGNGQRFHTTDIAKVLILHGADPLKAFDSMIKFNDFFEGDLSWYNGDIQKLERKFITNSIRRKLF